MKRVLAIGDIHGGLKALQQVMKRAEVTPEDKLIFLGDYVDGWSDSAKVVSYLINLAKQNSCVFIRGNHDDLVHNWLKTEETNETWLAHGGQVTLDAYRKLTDEETKKHNTFYSQMVDYVVDNDNRLFLHAGFTNPNGPQHEYFKPMCYWDRTLWEMVSAMANKPKDVFKHYPKRLDLYNEIFIGHTPTQRVGSDVPVNYQNVWNVDTGAAFKGAVSIIDVNTKDVWQSDPVMSLYPDESGRN